MVKVISALTMYYHIVYLTWLLLKFCWKSSFISLHFTFIYRFCWVTMEMMGEREIILVLLKKITNMLLNCLVNVIKTALCMKCDICTSTIGCKYEASNTWSNMHIVINAQKTFGDLKDGLLDCRFWFSSVSRNRFFFKVQWHSKY